MRNTNPILIVEDDEDDCELIQIALTELGLQNEQKCFRNGTEALAYLKNSRISTFLILSDVNMPLLNGLEFKAEINRDEKLKKQSIPFVFLSTSSSQKEIEIAYDMSVQGFFKKPNSFNEIKNILHTVTSYWNVARHPNSNN
jgi:CheY-like chemotaxis protein